MYLNEEIVFFNENCKNKEEVIQKLADEFLKKGLVKDTFFQAVIDREKVYPTGLDINGVGVAIPHTDGIHIVNPQIGFMSLKEPVVFKNMVDETEEIKVRAIFMLGLVKSEDQVNMLQKLVGLFQDKELLKRIIDCRNIKEFKEIMKEADIT